jgi:hypothetical protein
MAAALDEIDLSSLLHPWTSVADHRTLGGARIRAIGDCLAFCIR